MKDLLGKVSLFINSSFGFSKELSQKGVKISLTKYMYGFGKLQEMIENKETAYRAKPSHINISI